MAQSYTLNELIQATFMKARNENIKIEMKVTPDKNDTSSETDNGKDV